ncbi:hypothetical protein VE02_03142 [Pseudogymnoascus sp. 03VT05]|nr:hypothetical protein VE02_03142 [Pseudogymnoascus sp. 03VT05]
MPLLKTRKALYPYGQYSQSSNDILNLQGQTFLCRNLAKHLMLEAQTWSSMV